MRESLRKWSIWEDTLLPKLPSRLIIYMSSDICLICDMVVGGRNFSSSSQYFSSRLESLWRQIWVIRWDHNLSLSWGWWYIVGRGMMSREILWNPFKPKLDKWEVFNLFIFCELFSKLSLRLAIYHDYISNRKKGGNHMCLWWS